nr:hypothetical protein [Methylobacterium sp. Leaf122]
MKPDPCAPVICPFCDEDGFDLYGLKTHFNMGWCEPFEAISETDRLNVPASPLATGEAANRKLLSGQNVSLTNLPDHSANAEATKGEPATSCAGTLSPSSNPIPHGGL